MSTITGYTHSGTILDGDDDSSWNRSQAQLMKDTVRHERENSTESKVLEGRKNG